MSYALAALVALGVAAYGVSLALWPYGRCLACKGTGRSRGSTAKRYGLCKVCEGGRKRRLRVGAKWVRPDLRRKQR